VTCWMLSNFILVAAVLNVAGFQEINTDTDAANQNGEIYLSVVLWSVAGLSLFRFIGACWFLVVRIVSAMMFLWVCSMLMFPVPWCVRRFVRSIVDCNFDLRATDVMSQQRIYDTSAERGCDKMR